MESHSPVRQWDSETKCQVSYSVFEVITWWTDIGKAAFFFAFHSVCYLVSQQCLDGKTIPDVVPVEIMHSQAKIKEQL